MLISKLRALTGELSYGNHHLCPDTRGVAAVVVLYKYPTREAHGGRYVTQQLTRNRESRHSLIKHSAVDSELIGRRALDSPRSCGSGVSSASTHGPSMSGGTSDKDCMSRHKRLRPTTE